MIRSVYSYAFYSTGLSAIFEGDNIDNIESYAFYGCSSLSYINIPNA